MHDISPTAGAVAVSLATSYAIADVLRISTNREPGLGRHT
jgi:hypothetical protein